MIPLVSLGRVLVVAGAQPQETTTYSSSTPRLVACGIHRVRDGKIVESWVYKDEVEALARVGALSITPGAGQT